MKRNTNCLRITYSKIISVLYDYVHDAGILYIDAADYIPSPHSFIHSFTLLRLFMFFFHFTSFFP